MSDFAKISGAGPEQPYGVGINYGAVDANFKRVAQRVQKIEILDELPTPSMEYYGTDVMVYDDVAGDIPYIGLQSADGGNTWAEYVGDVYDGATGPLLFPVEQFKSVGDTVPEEIRGILDGNFQQVWDERQKRNISANLPEPSAYIRGWKWNHETIDGSTKFIICCKAADGTYYWKGPCQYIDPTIPVDPSDPPADDPYPENQRLVIDRFEPNDVKIWDSTVEGNVRCTADDENYIEGTTSMRITKCVEIDNFDGDENGDVEWEVTDNSCVISEDTVTKDEGDASLKIEVNTGGAYTPVTAPTQLPGGFRFDVGIFDPWLPGPYMFFEQEGVHHPTALSGATITKITVPMWLRNLEFFGSDRAEQLAFAIAWGMKFRYEIWKPVYTGNDGVNYLGVKLFDTVTVDNYSKVNGSDGFDYKCTATHISTADSEPITGGDWESYWEKIDPPTSIEDAWQVDTQYYAGSMYRCKQNHTSTVDNKPGTGVDWQDYWLAEPSLNFASWDSCRPSEWAVSQSYEGTLHGNTDFINAEDMINAVPNFGVGAAVDVEFPCTTPITVPVGNEAVIIAHAYFSLTSNPYANIDPDVLSAYISFVPRSASDASAVTSTAYMFEEPSGFEQRTGGSCLSNSRVYTGGARYSLVPEIKLTGDWDGQEPEISRTFDSETDETDLSNQLSHKMKVKSTFEDVDLTLYTTYTDDDGVETETSKTWNITSAEYSSGGTITWDISDVKNENKDNLTSARVKIAFNTDPESGQALWLDIWEACPGDSEDSHKVYRKYTKSFNLTDYDEIDIWVRGPSDTYIVGQIGFKFSGGIQYFDLVSEGDFSVNQLDISGVSNRAGMNYIEIIPPSGETEFPESFNVDFCIAPVQ